MVAEFPAGLLVVHGGVDMEPTAATFSSLTLAAEAGAAVLLETKDALAAATAALAVLEDDPAFNAGYGSVLTREGTVETDGAVADGRTGRCAGVAAVPAIRHPSALARQLLTQGDTVLLVGAAAQAYGVEHGHVPEDLRTPEQVTALADGDRRSPFTGRATTAVPVPSETVGCLVVHHDGQVVAASSTGGLRGKRSGRVGDAAVPGAGYWADARFGVLCSGSGEVALRGTLARRLAERASDAGCAAAARWAVTEAASIGATLAVLVVDGATGEVVAAHNGASFPVVVHDGRRSARHLAVDVGGAVR